MDIPCIDKPPHRSVTQRHRISETTVAVQPYCKHHQGKADSARVRMCTAQPRQPGSRRTGIGCGLLGERGRALISKAKNDLGTWPASSWRPAGNVSFRTEKCQFSTEKCQFCSPARRLPLPQRGTKLVMWSTRTPAEPASCRARPDPGL